MSRKPVFPDDVVERVLARRGALHPFPPLVPARTALIVIDMQTAFVGRGYPTTIDGAADLVPLLNRLAAAVRAGGGHVVWVISTYGPRTEDRWSNLFDHVFTAEVASGLHAALSEGAEGHALWPLLSRRPEDSTVSKNRFSAFLGSGGELRKLLDRRGIETVLIAGTMTSVCCESTAREAAMLDYRTIMVADANAGRSAQEDLATYSTFLQSFGDVAMSEDIIERFRQGAATPAAGAARR
jgi:ureidoacrylate peracid hydrolase